MERRISIHSKMSNSNVYKSIEKNLGGKDDDAETVQVLYENTELARHLQRMDENHDVVKSILDSMEEKIHHMTFKQQNIAAVVKKGVSDMKDKVTTLKAIRDQQVMDNNNDNNNNNNNNNVVFNFFL